MGVAGHVTLRGTVCGQKKGSDLKQICLSRNEKR